MMRHQATVVVYTDDEVLSGERTKEVTSGPPRIG